MTATCHDDDDDDDDDDAVIVSFRCSLECSVPIPLVSKLDSVSFRTVPSKTVGDWQPAAVTRERVNV